jgi:hypothetical protein
LYLLYIKKVKPFFEKTFFMIVAAIKRFWSANGWSIILFGSLFVLLILWFLSWRSTTERGSSSTSIEQILKTIFYPQAVSETILATDTSRIPIPFSSSRDNTIVPTQSSLSPTSRGEKRCKEFLEFLFKKPFEKARPAFLVNPVTNQALELDCYNEDLKLAVEYNGKQHYEYNKMMHQNSRHSFQNQQYRDLMKKDMCDKNGIRLIIVPYRVAPDKIPEFLYIELKKLGYIHSALLNFESKEDTVTVVGR